MFDKKILLSHQYYYPAFEMLKDRVTPESRKELLDSLPNGNKNVMLYIHIPFCDSKCAFCGFDKHYNLEDIQAYMDRLREELGYYSRFGFHLKNIHFGGGTPTLIPGEQLSDLVHFIRENYDCAPDMNINIEGSATSIWRDDIIQFIKESGITRTSVGVQTFNRRLREEIFQTKATLEQVYQTLETLRDNEIDVFTDILFGYPDFGIGESPEDIVINDLKTAAAFGAAGIDFSHYYPYANKLTDYISENGIAYPTTAELIHIMNRGKEVMNELGYQQETSYGFVKRGNIIIETSYYGGTEEVTDTLAVGSSAFGSLNGYKYRNSMYAGYMRKSLPSYMQVKKMSYRQLQQENVVSFSKLLRLDKVLLQNCAFRDELEPKLHTLMENGMVEENESQYLLTRKGWNFVDNVYYYMLDEEERRILEHETTIIRYE